MSRDQGMQSLGIDLGALSGADPMAMRFEHPTCPGALLRISRSELSALQAAGARFAEEGTAVPFQGHGPARVYCTSLVAAWKGAAGQVVYGGRCFGCGQLEKRNREVLRERVEARP